MVGLIPYGRLQDGKYGVLLQNGTNTPLAAAIEVLNSLPAVASVDNFDGRTVFSITNATMYVFSTNPSPRWVALEGIPARVGAVNGMPPTSPVPQSGSLFFDTDTQVMFVWDGSAWQPIGGRYAAQIFTQKYVGDGIQLSFPMGVLDTVPPDYVEVFLDGVRQSPNPTGDYNVIGTSVVFSSPIPSGVRILIRSLVSTVLTQNTQVYSATFTATAGQTIFNVGVPGSDPASTFVFVNGLQKALNLDYTVSASDTRVTSFVKINPTTVRMTTMISHGMTVGSTFRLFGALETQYNNTTFTVASVFSTTQVDITVNVGDPASATANPILYFNPPYRNDRVIMGTPLSGGEKVDIRILKNVLVAPSQGEANVLASIGSGLGLDAGKSGTTLQLKSLVAGPNVNLVSTPTDITIGVSTANSFEDRVGINTNYYIVNGTESYVGIRNTTTTVVIDLSGIPTGTNTSGRKITIKDESGGASINNITVNTGGIPIDGGAGIYVISINYGYVTLVSDGFNWYITGRN